MSRTTFCFTEEQARTLVEYQASANDVMSTAWRTSGNTAIAYFRAANVELFESLIEIGYKWWKGEGAIDTAKVTQELVDALHFVLSDHIRTIMTKNEARGEEAALSFVVSSLVSIREPELKLIGAYAGHRGALAISDLTIQDIIEQAMFQYLRDGYASMGWLAILFERLEVQADQIFGYYLAKNTLNKFRTANGNGEGTYGQIWADREDSDFLQDFVELSVENGDELNVEAITGFLTNTYEDLAAQGATKVK